MSERAAVPVDAQARNLALDPATSCIVQAPAGSGKTTLLVSRFIRLLALADYPEQVLAITFTRKAAAEMRLRVTALLADENSSETAKARARDAQRGWHLANNPSRLNIRTIDSFAMSLTRQMPVSSGFDRSARLVENADELYSLAARRLFRRLYSDDPLAEEIGRFIALIDNDAHKARRLLATMLARRDHWLDEVTGIAAAYRNDPGSVLELLNGALQSLVAAVTDNLEQLLPAATLKELEWAVGYARGLARTEPGAFWQAAGWLLTTAKGTFRKQLTVNDGFAAKFREEKERALELIEALDRLGLQERIVALRLLPSKSLSPEQVDDLVAICISLSLSVIDLSSVMRSQGAADFTELILAARRALRTGDHPTELALAIDNRIRHILVDEFQDTSVVQFQLLELLVQGWSEESGVSLFAVGDPMQSIYRFRDADVGLFYRAERQGLDQIRLNPLRLSTNFRSAPQLVDWFNDIFSGVMGEEIDPLIGRVPYNSCNARADSTGGAIVRVFQSEEDERLALVERIAGLQDEEPDAAIALLVRSRTHLAGVLQELRRTGIRWQATDIDALADTPAVTDLLSLAAAIASPTDRLAWHSLLRSPWVGLGLKDLEAVSEMHNWDMASLQRLTERLSPDGKPRLERLISALDAWLPAVHEKPPRTVLESIWIQCGGAAAYGSDAAIDHAERFLELVDELGSEGLDVDRLRLGADNLFAVDSAVANLQILTIHKAKGLEFDHVLLPFLDRQTKPTEAPLLRWRLQNNRLLMAARESGPLYDWLAEEDRQRERHELQRLLYVGCTRARRTLMLTAVKPDEKPARGSLLHLLWPNVAELAPETFRRPERQQPQSASGGPMLHRLASDFQWQPPVRRPLNLAHQSIHASRQEVGELVAADRIGSRRQVALGNLVHACLGDLGRAGLPENPGAWIDSQQPLWRARLAGVGLTAENLQYCLEETARQVAGVLADETGRWVLQGGRDGAWEPGVTGLVDGALHSCRFDRAFEHDGERWVVDFKTGPVGGEAQSLQELIARHRPQLERYRTLAQALYEQPVRSALYLTALPRFVELRAIPGDRTQG